MLDEQEFQTAKMIPSVWTKPRTDRRRNERSTGAFPHLNVVEEYDSDLEDYCCRARAGHPEKTTVPEQGDCISEDEWTQIVESMTPEEWAIFISTKESEETATPSFDLPSTEWPSLDHKSLHKEAIIEVGEGLATPLQVDDGFVEIIKADDAESQSWALLSRREDDAGSVVSWRSWSTAPPLTFREALLRSNVPMADVCKPAGATRNVVSKRPPLEKETLGNNDDILYELRDSAKTMRGGKLQFRVKKDNR